MVCVALRLAAVAAAASAVDASASALPEQDSFAAASATCADGDNRDDDVSSGCDADANAVLTSLLQTVASRGGGHRRRLAQERLAATGDCEDGAFTMVPASVWQFATDDWSTLGPQRTHTEELPRLRRSPRPAGGLLNTNGTMAGQPPGMPEVDATEDTYLPPLSKPTEINVTQELRETCFFWEGYHSLGYVSDDHFFCVDEKICPSSEAERKRLRASFLNSREVVAQNMPAIHLTQGSWDGIYHVLVEGLAKVNPHIEELRAGRMQLFVHTVKTKKFLEPVLRRLGIPTSNVAYAWPDEKVSEPKGTYRFCAPTMFINYGRQGVPVGGYVAQWGNPVLRELLELPCGAGRELNDKCSKPNGVEPDGIVLLSRGNGSRTLGNEEELLQALRTLGRPVKRVLPGPDNFDELIEVLSHAKVVVGAHGANMLNMLYAPPKTAVVEIVAKGPWKPVNYHYWAMAGSLDFKYTAVGHNLLKSEYNATLAADPMTQDKAVGRFAPDPETVKKAVSAMLQ
eukprot:TRINITY_DN48897_c0_g1_i1.p1 TRINITY_DN48897_c0_g1~~TRINITY_DN48897_c0_g1_i1.p1  ORF type:complete len:513 (+),score=118.54 TRINITY_DN48897_c0_g1_i1:100-1638(+)